MPASLFGSGSAGLGLSIVRAKPEVRGTGLHTDQEPRGRGPYKSITYDIGSWRAGDDGRTPGPGSRKCTPYLLPGAWWPAVGAPLQRWVRHLGWGRSDFGGRVARSAAFDHLGYTREKAIDFGDQNRTPARRYWMNLVCSVRGHDRSRRRDYAAHILVFRIGPRSCVRDGAAAYSVTATSLARVLGDDSM